jgi:hypothetical protein
MIQKFFEFLAIGVVTPVIYLVYCGAAILTTFLFGFPVAVGIYLIQVAMDLLLSNGV